VNYDFTPTYFNLTSYITLTVELRTGDHVLGYRGLSTPFGTISKLKPPLRDDSAYRSISHYGPMWFGYHASEVPGAPDLSSMYDNTTKVLYIQGPMNFMNYRQPNETGAMLLYHSAPWLEFNVANYTWPDAGMLSLPGTNAAGGSMSSSMTAAMAALAMAILLSIVATVTVVVEVRRRDD
jgi:hypothetical protein